MAFPVSCHTSTCPTPDSLPDSSPDRLALYVDACPAESENDPPHATDPLESRPHGAVALNTPSTGRSSNPGLRDQG